MGLFSNNKKLCPVCENPTPKLLPTKVDGTPICKECAKKIFLPNGMINQMTVDSFLQYMHFYSENQSLRDSFTETYHYDFGFFDSDIFLDATNGLFRLNRDKNSFAFEKSCLKGFRILEDDKPLFESQGNVLRCHESKVPEKVKGMDSLIEQFKARRQEYEFMERMERRREEEARKRGEEVQHRYISEPSFTGNEPFQNFYVELTLEHPYWSDFRVEVYGPKFSRDYPSIESFLCNYENEVGKMHELAANLMQFMCPGAQEIDDASAAEPVAKQAPVTGMSAIKEIKQYKELLDAGIITAEEFATKKSQLLGL